MEPERTFEQYPHAVSDELDADLFIEPPSTAHRDRYARHSHELPDESSEASSRALIRLVPLLYGGLFGGLANNILLGFVVGAMLSMCFDLLMGRNSMLRSLFRTRGASS